LGITGGIVADNDLEEYRDLVKPIFPDLFPVAWDSDWKLILLGLSGNWVPDAIYYYDNEEMLSQDVAPLPLAMLLLAQDFYTFLKELY
jgi:hypothetical protein